MAVLLTKKVARHGLLQPPQECFRGRDAPSSGIVLTDFESAFPSIKISWVLRALGTMGVPVACVKSSQALYQNNSAAIYLFGKMFGSFEIGRVEPVLSWLKSRLPSQLMLALACADDFCFGLRCLFGALEPLF
eukprot:8981187-Pyramimonas_sp.AAC.1